MLWAPWRMEYIREEKEEGCIFCTKPMEQNDERNLILVRTARSFVMMNRYPYNNGHLMVVPTRHSTDLQDLNALEFQDLFELMRTCVRVLKIAIAPHGFNIGFNLGTAGGAGEAHLHLHIVPRWTGDTNFMPVIAETRIIPEYLRDTFRKLRSLFDDQLKQGPA
jgi:ATP adenylyltransferase